MARRTCACFNRIVFMSTFKILVLIFMTGSAKLTFAFDQIKCVLRPVRCVTAKAPVI